MMNGKMVAPREPKALTITLAEPAELGNISVRAGYVPASMAELEIPASKANTKAISYVGENGIPIRKTPITIEETIIKGFLPNLSDNTPVRPYVSNLPIPIAAMR